MKRVLLPALLALGLVAAAHGVARAANTTFVTAPNGQQVMPISPPNQANGTPGSIDNMAIGQTTPAPGTFSTVSIQAKGSIPSAIGWNSAYSIAPSISYSSGNAAVGSAGITPEALFDQFSTARSAPGATFWAAASGGNDGNNCLTSGTACATIGGAVTKCNTAAVPCKVFVTNAAGVSTFYKGAAFNNFNTVYPTVDIAFVAIGGVRLTICQCDAFAAPSKDATFTNTYSFALTNVERVFDLTRRDQFGNYVELTNVSSNAIANVTPNSWNLTTGTIYIQRADGAAVTNTNTRIYRSGGGRMVGMNNATQTSMFIGGDTTGDGFDIEGGTDGIKTTFTTYVSALDAIVVANTSFKYAGGVVTPTGNCVSIDSFNGIAAFFNVQAGACATDGFNGHNQITLTGGVPVVSMLTVNSAAFDNGKGTAQSANCLTAHEDVLWVDIGGWCWGNHGGSVRNIGQSKAYMLGTIVQMDQGDILAGGTSPPTAYRVDNTAQLYLEQVQMMMPAATFGLYATSTAAIFVKNSRIGRQPNAGAGTFGSF